MLLSRAVLGTVRRVVGATPAGQALRRGLVAGRMVAERWTLASTRRPAFRRGRILAYHSIGTSSWGVNDVTPRDFERHLQVAADDGWSFCTPAEVIADPGPRRLALTFDDGAASVLRNAVPVLRHHQIPATFFIVTGWIDGQGHLARDEVLDWSGVRALLDAGFTVGSHSVTHRDMSRLTPEQARHELAESRRRIQEMAGIDTPEFAIPLGQARHWSAAVQQLARDVGYKVVYAQAENTRPEGTVARTFVTRFDRPRLFRAALNGAFDEWDEWY